MKAAFRVVACFGLLAGTAGAELIENGTFARNTSGWEMATPSVYGPAPGAVVENGEFQLSNLSGAVFGYLTVNQAVNIESGKTYRLSFEAKGVGTGQYLVAIHDPGRLAHTSKLFTPSAEWEKIAIDFAGAFDTDSRWVRDWLNATKGSRLENGHTVNTTLHKVRERKGAGPSRTWLTFGVGALNGSFALRNVSLVEVTQGAK